MPTLFQYLIKLSCGLAIVYLFYELVLRRLTFFNSNRWYLLGSSLLCFVIPAININSLVKPQQLNTSGVVEFIPAIDTYIVTETITVQQTATSTLSVWDGCCIVLALGSLLLLMRLAIQYLSYRNIRKTAQLLARDAINIYQVDKPIAPFSFGRDIFINQQLHTEAELQEIIRHELVHVKQHHTVDIILTEIICILNWYNPFAWLLRHAVRQNLEFIADSHVIQSGVNKKDYQYLLLKVIGTPQFCLANQFNFSSLKKRIIMINKMPSAKAHLVKFLLALPLIAMLLIACRNNAQEQNGDHTITIYGLVLDGGKDMMGTTPIQGASVTEIYSNTTVVTDDRGFYSLVIPVKKFPLNTELVFKKEGFGVRSSKTNFLSSSIKAPSVFNNMALPPPGSHFKFYTEVTEFSLSEHNGSKTATEAYEYAHLVNEELHLNSVTSLQLQQLIKTSEHPFWSLNGMSNLYDRDGNSVSTAKFTDVVYVNGKKMTVEEVNKTIKRKDVVKVAVEFGDQVEKWYGSEETAFEVYILHTRLRD
jgi:beta-lactamase regulating signal transducer with metallopeptidase domain